MCAGFSDKGDVKSGVVRVGVGRFWAVRANHLDERAAGLVAIPRFSSLRLSASHVEEEKEESRVG